MELEVAIEIVPYAGRNNSKSVHFIFFDRHIFTVGNSASRCETTSILADRSPPGSLLPLNEQIFPRGCFFPLLDRSGPSKIWAIDEKCICESRRSLRLPAPMYNAPHPSCELELLLDPHLVSSIVYSLARYPRFRNSFVRFLRRSHLQIWKSRKPNVRLILRSGFASKFDHAWEDRIWKLCMWNELVKEHLAWLSTLGGAFSALGKIGFRAFAERAGKISFSQLRLAEFLGDPILQARSRIYLALSMIQQEKFSLAKKILRRELYLSRSELVSSESEKLESIIRSVWMHLIFEKQQRKTLEEERNLIKRASRLVFDDETMRTKKSLADTILAISNMKVVQGFS